MKKCDNHYHCEYWANIIYKIARTHIARIQAILDMPTNIAEIAAFNTFAEELHDDLNNAITDGGIVEMLAQHLITKPVFGALFQDYRFAQHNPMSIAVQVIMNKLHEHHINKEDDTLQRFYDSVKCVAKTSTMPQQTKDRCIAIRQVFPKRLPTDDRALGHRLYPCGSSGFGSGKIITDKLHYRFAIRR